MKIIAKGRFINSFIHIILPKMEKSGKMADRVTVKKPEEIKEIEEKIELPTKVEKQLHSPHDTFKTMSDNMGKSKHTYYTTAHEADLSVKIAQNIENLQPGFPNRYLATIRFLKEST